MSEDETAEVTETTETAETTETTETQDSPWYSEDWRQQIAGDDEKALNQLGRYKTPADIWTKARALEQRVSSGELKDSSPFPVDGTPEQQAAWRETNAIPDSPDKYELPADVTDEDKQALGGFLEHAHSNNFSNDTVKAMLGFFSEQGAAAEKAQADAEAEVAQKAEDELRAEWGNEYRAHMNRIAALTDMFPEGEGEALLDARLPDGTKVRHSKNAMSFLLDSALAVNPATTLTDDGKGGTIDSIQDEIAQIKDVMKTDRNKYNNDPRMQQRYRELLQAETKLKQRGAA